MRIAMCLTDDPADSWVVDADKALSELHRTSDRLMSEAPTPGWWDDRRAEVQRIHLLEDIARHRKATAYQEAEANRAIALQQRKRQEAAWDQWQSGRPGIPVGFFDGRGA